MTDDDVRKLMIDELAELKALRESSSEARETVALDQQSVGRLSRMDAMQGQAMAKASEQRRRARVSMIKAALQRLDDGEYGECEECGEPIPAGRIAIDPTVTACVACASAR